MDRATSKAHKSCSQQGGRLSGLTAYSKSWACWDVPGCTPQSHSVSSCIEPFAPRNNGSPLSRLSFTLLSVIISPLNCFHPTLASSSVPPELGQEKMNMVCTCMWVSEGGCQCWVSPGYTVKLWASSQPSLSLTQQIKILGADSSFCSVGLASTLRTEKHPQTYFLKGARAT